MRSDLPHSRARGSHADLDPCTDFKDCWGDPIRIISETAASGFKSSSFSKNASSSVVDLGVCPFSPHHERRSESESQPSERVTLADGDVRMLETFARTQSSTVRAVQSSHRSTGCTPRSSASSCTGVLAMTCGRRPFVPVSVSTRSQAFLTRFGGRETTAQT